MGQIALVADGEIARAVLGSCIGLSIYDTRRRIGAIAHVVLPASSGRTGTPGKFVDTALAQMLDELLAAGADLRRLSAKLAGGSNMFAANGPFRIGEQNIEAAKQALEQAKIRLAGQHLGGTSGRRITFHGSDGELAVEIAGCPVTTI